MENNTSTSYLDKKALILNELAQAKELLLQLESDLGVATSTNGYLLLPIILSSCEKSLSMLSRMKSEAITEPQTTGSTESPCLVNDCDSDLSGGNSYKKRKLIPRWTEQVRVCEQTGLEGPIEDGYSWRKYGQKDILGATYPRGYYKCAHKNSQDCLAMKQVQRTDEDPSIFTVTYRGRHTCVEAANLLQGQSQNRHVDQPNEKRQKTSQGGTIINFQTGGLVKTEDFGTTQTVLRSPSFSFPCASTSIPFTEKEIFSSMTPDNHFMSSPFSSPYLSPSTSDSNSFSPHRVQDLQVSDYDLSDFTSAVTPAAFDSTDFYFDLDFFSGL